MCGGDTLMFSYIGRLRSFWFKILNFNTLWGGGGQENEYLGGGGVCHFCGSFLGVIIKMDDI